MKLIVLAVLFFGSACSHVLKDQVESTTADSESANLKDAFAEIIKTKCDKVGGEEAYQKFVDASESMMDCLKTHLPNSKNETEDSNSSEDICVYKKNNIRECMNKMIDFFKDCSEPEEKYIPDFIFDVLDNLMELFCVDNNIKGLDEPEATQCFMTLLTDADIFVVCNENQFEILKKTDDSIVTKDELCTDIETYGRCFNKYLNKKCPKDKQFKKFTSQVLDALAGPCHNQENQSRKMKIKHRLI